MNSENEQIIAVPTNIVTGFLGVGKTSAILNLMKHKPDNERWAVLVNEFGEIGVDGSLFEGQRSQQQQVFIREVPGGCMCCAAGLPMQIALNQLLAEAKPDRLLIEPTGLGHPKEVLQVLSSEHYQSVLSLQKTLTLVDARKLSDPRYTGHDTFNQQIAIADTVVGNKVDLYQANEKEQLQSYVEQHGKPHTQVIFAQHGNIDLSEFEGPTAANEQPAHHHHHGHSKPLVSEQPMPESGVLKATNEGEGFVSVGWRFSPDKVFSRQKLVHLLVGLTVERMKAVFITDDGVFGYNLTPDGLTEVELDDCMESRIELISDSLGDKLEEQILSCVTD
ncbi:cobalamin biosynthesis protein CobW [Photobacterium rosenbergii]|uniref:Cobalamin biosynthesis protein CobW n=1 Tax=Photobacterium rosenbergii TaxID=294936 RepID=A0A2T3NF69_9GAMM|nr:GTP-binding protein [Photobacterium rosenbergii]PSW13200.1 cobalamin biosynthesis protein CobW [Photobacterium rosenbergii]